ncbi:MAG: cyclic lactone autoinducer peptide [Clostridiales bacterium]|nr:cyclic lactone autoinducer peptide [Clostridiales bacterium]MBQ6271978.1 cyclic lactone autoinducer peptide [Clostridiales bacterium]MBR4011128.1 cyclic lactone autoinducer peptide [Clostridiales bacterium]MCR5058649.1 cyclic lactone autoinducer peptide [Clostridiales bacterium]
MMKNVMAGILAKAAMKTAEKNANSTCHLYFYQPKEPKSLDKLKKFKK